MRWYTRARRGVPILIGRTPNGERLPGGPYTLTQLVVFAATLGVGQVTVGLWGRFGGIGNLIVLAVTAVGLAWVASRVPTEKANGWAVFHGVRHTATISRAGKHRGGPVKVRGAHQVRGRVHVDLADVVDQEVVVPPGEPAVDLEKFKGGGRRRATPAQAAWAATGEEW